MIVVSDTTPIISLMKVSQLEVLKKLFGTILIPHAVYDELTSNTSFPNEIELIKKCSYIKVVEVENIQSVSILQRAMGLDLGESEAIIYADNHKTDFLLMDEAAGRRVAKSMGLKIMGTIGILLNAFDDKILTIEEAEEALKQLKSSNRRISDDLLNDALDYIHSK